MLSDLSLVIINNHLHVNVVALDAHELISKVMANSISDIFVVLFALSMFPTLRTQTLVTLEKKISDKEF